MDAGHQSASAGLAAEAERPPLVQQPASKPHRVAAMSVAAQASTQVRLTGRRWWLACGAVLAVVLLATVPTTGDIGLTWDEPAYRYSQQLSAQWWGRLAQARDRAALAELLDPDALLYYWPYGRYGINFHPPLAGQLNLLTHAVFGRWMKDIPSRRLASVFEFALTITIAFGFLARRYGPWVGGVAAGSLLLMPRLYGDGHIAGTDTPGLLLWATAAVAFWNGLHEPQARRWRVLVGILVGLAFVEKVAAVLVLAPLLTWLILANLPRASRGPGSRAAWVDGVLTSVAMLLPLGIAFMEMLRLAAQFPAPNMTDLFDPRYRSPIPGAILAVPFVVWVVREVMRRVFPRHPVWGVERPALETWTSVLAFAPVVGWLGNPAWWREALPRLAHYYVISRGRRGSLPDIQIMYFGQAYEFSLPWPNAWVLIGITVPAGILAASLIGLVFTLRNVGRDRLPLYFLAHLVTLPAMRMLETPAHDGVRLFLPTFFFLAAMAGWGTVWLADGLAAALRARPVWPRSVLAALVLAPAAWQLASIHPFELSYYNELIGGPRGAWKRGFELSYWYDAFNQQTLDEINKTEMPRDARVAFLNDKSNSCPVFSELQSLGYLRGDILPLDDRGLTEFPYVWLLTHDSKASAFTRLLFVMRPWYSREPKQLDGLRVATVADPPAVARAWMLQLLLDARYEGPPEPPALPAWVTRYAPWFARFWGVGVTRVPRLGINNTVLNWAKNDPQGLRSAARAIADREPERTAESRRLWKILENHGAMRASGRLAMFWSRPKALVEAVDIVIESPDALRKVLLRYPYTDPDDIDGYLDAKLASQ